MHRMPIIARICMQEHGTYPEDFTGQGNIFWLSSFWYLSLIIYATSIIWLYSTWGADNRFETCQTQQMTSTTLLARLRHSKRILRLLLSTKPASLHNPRRHRNTILQAIGSKRSRKKASQRRVSIRMPRSRWKYCNMSVTLIYWRRCPFLKPVESARMEESCVWR